MANTQSGNSLFANATGSLSTTTNLKVTSIIFTSSSATDSVELRETASGSTKIILQNGVANLSQIFRFISEPMLFTQGIYVASLSSGASVTIVTRT